MNELDYVRDNPYQDETEQLYQYYLNSIPERETFSPFIDPEPSAEQRPNNWEFEIPTDQRYRLALDKVMRDRWAREKMYHWGKDPIQEKLRNVDHGLQSWVDTHKGLGDTERAARPVIYNLLKWMAQKNPRGVGALLDHIGSTRYSGTLGSEDPNPFTEASPPSWESVRWGRRPFWAPD